MLYQNSLSNTAVITLGY